MTKKRFRGFAMIDTIAALGLFGATLGYFVMPLMRDHIRARALSSYAAQLTDLGNYIQSNYLAKNAAALAAGSAISGYANPLAPTIAELNAAKVLNGYPVAGVLGGNFIIRVSRVPAGCTPPACDVVATISGTNPIGRADGGAQPDIYAAGAIVAEGGFDFGYATTATPALFTGYGNKWSLVNPANTAGVVGVRVGFGSSALSQFCARGGDCSYANLTTTGNLVSNGTLTSTGTSTFNAGVTVGGTLRVNGNETVTGNSSAQTYAGDGTNVTNVQYSANAGYATNANHSVNADSATNAGYATNANYSNTSNYSNSAGTVSCGGVTGANYNVCTGQ